MSLITIMAVIFLMVGINAYFVAGEFATIGARRTRLEGLAEDGSLAARKLIPIVEDPVRLDNYVAACQLGITISSLVLGFYGERSLSGILETAILDAGLLSPGMAGTVSTVAVLALLTIFQIVIGETVPKTIAMRQPEKIALLMSAPMLFTVRMMQPAITLFNGAAIILMRLLRVNRDVSHSRVYSPEEIQALASESQLAGALGTIERTMLDNALELSALKARMVMIPRNRLVIGRADTPVEQLLTKVVTSPFSRLPLVDEDPEHIIGIVHLKDLFRLSLEGVDDVRSVIRPVPALPENTPVHEVWQALTRQRRYLAVLIDEYGGTAGIVTQEDLLEEIIGEVQDEFDEETTRWIEAPEGGTVLVRGDVLVVDVNSGLNLLLPTDRADTIAGLVLDELARIPAVGEVVTIDGVTLKVTQKRRNWVAQVAVTRPEPIPDAASESSDSEEGPDAGSPR